MVIIYIFMPYYSGVVVGDPVRGQSLVGYLNALVGVILALTAPFLGAIADQYGQRKPGWVLASLGIAAGAFALWFVLPADGGLGIWGGFVVLLLINVCFVYSEVFHNAMLPSIAPVSLIGRLSGLAYALANVGGLLLMLFILFAFALPGSGLWSFLPEVPWWGIDQSAHEHDRIVGPISAFWLLLFMAPVLLYCPDGRPAQDSLVSIARRGVADVLQTLKQLRHYANVAIYLLARMFFIDGMVGVMTFGGVYAAGTFGWDTVSLLIYGLCTSGSAMLGAYVGGRLDDRLGSLRTLKLTIAMSSLLLVALISITPSSIFFGVEVGTEKVWASPYFATTPEITYFLLNQLFAMFFVTGLSSSRAMMARISPPELMTQFFGLFALSGQVTAFLAPLMVAVATAWANSQRVGMATLVVLMVIGLGLLFVVREEQAEVART